MFNLGVLCLTGNGVPQDHEKAAGLIRGAAERGLAPAQSTLGLMYYEGEGVREDLVQAHAWLTAAVRQNFNHPYPEGGIAELRKHLEQELTFAQRQKAQVMAEFIEAGVRMAHTRES